MPAPIAGPVVPAVPPVAAGAPVRAHDLPWVDMKEVPPAPSYFRSYDQVRASAQELAAAHPELVSYEEIGQSAQTVAGTADRPLFALRLRSGQGVATTAEAGTRPKLLLLSGVHAREIANPEVVMRWAQGLVEGYGRDAAATSTLDTREVLVVPIVNPDGHAVIERAFATKDLDALWHRTSGVGVDLNRNFDFQWGTTGGSAKPTSINFRGAGPASEPEVQAVQQFVQREHPNLLLDWHSRGNVMLLPYGHTADPAPDADRLRAIGEQFARLNGYAVEPSHDYNPDSGTSKDWAYGTLGIPAFTIETGMTWHQDDATFADTFAKAVPVLDYAARIAAKPYDLAAGPAVDSVTVDATGALQATVAGAPGSGAIAGAELVRNPDAKPGTGKPLHAVDGAFDGAAELATGALPADMPGGLLWVRARDGAGNWGAATPQWVYPTA